MYVYALRETRTHETDLYTRFEDNVVRHGGDHIWSRLLRPLVNSINSDISRYARAVENQTITVLVAMKNRLAVAVGARHERAVRCYGKNITRNQSPNSTVDIRFGR